MKELLIKHELNGKVINRFRVKPNVKSDVFIVGSSRKANIRIIGDNISPIHAAFEVRNGVWNIIDLGSQTGTWLKNKPILENEVNHLIHVRIGEHSLSVEPIATIDDRVFKESKKIDIAGNNATVYQQIAIFYQNKLVESYLEKPKKDLKIPYGKELIDIKAPVNADWIENKRRDYVIKNRLVRSAKFENKEKSIWSVFPKDLVKPFSYAFGSACLFFLSLYIIPKALNSDPGGLKDNQYTRLIFDQKTIEKQRKKSAVLIKKLEEKKIDKVVKTKKVTSKIKNSEKKLAKLAPSRSSQVIRAKVDKVVSSIKASGLSSLVSKVSQRASSNARIIKSSGFKAGSGQGSRAFASINDVKNSAKLSDATKKGLFRVRGISTGGEAGGSKVSSSLGGLSGTGIGSATVGALDEETEVEGGLTASQIARVVKKNLGAIRYCYERQLVANPNLYGKIKVEFVISPTGKVVTQRIKSTTMQHALTEGCILRKIKKWVFPFPKGGSEVAVSYPFYFKSTK